MRSGRLSLDPSRDRIGQERLFLSPSISQTGGAGLRSRLSSCGEPKSVGSELVEHPVVPVGQPDKAKTGRGSESGAVDKGPTDDPAGRRVDATEVALHRPEPDRGTVERDR